MRPAPGVSLRRPEDGPYTCIVCGRELRTSALAAHGCRGHRLGEPPPRPFPLRPRPVIRARNEQREIPFPLGKVTAR